MPFAKWHRTVVSKTAKKSEWMLFFESGLFGLVAFLIFFFYTNSLGIPSAVNKAVADASVILIGLSMLLSSVCYFWDFADKLIIYRKHLGLAGFTMVIVHIVLSWSVFAKLFALSFWLQPTARAAVAGALATAIFSMMAFISNKHAAYEMGGVWWRRFLRFGYPGLFLVLLHVLFLKLARWVAWAQAGFEKPPAISLLVSLFILIVIGMRLALWWALLQKKRALAKKTRTG